MKQREKFKRIINFLASGVIIAVEVICFAYIWYAVYIDLLDKGDQFWRKGNWAVIGSYALIIFLLTKIMGGFKIGYLRITDVLLAQTIAIICSNIAIYFQLCIIFREYVSVTPLLEMTIVEFAFIIPWVFYGRFIFNKLYPPKQTIVVYGAYSPADLIKKINSRKDKYDICASINISAGMERIKEEVNKYEAVVICDVPSGIRNLILKYCYSKSIRTYFTPKISDIMIQSGDSIHLFDTPLTLMRNYGLSFEQQAIKRLLDIIFAIIALIVFSPFMIISAILIKLYDGGPVFYYQDRLTISGKIFKIIKFRSMCVDSEKDGVRLAKKNDSRITPVGKFLRNTHFDEIPQILNILKGDMSFVGPRPERPEIASQYEKDIPEFEYRLKVKAGLTGYAQVYGKYNTTPYDKLKLDLTYITNYSVWLDLKLLVLTVKIVFQKESAEGVDANQTTASKKK